MRIRGQEGKRREPMAALNGGNLEVWLANNDNGDVLRKEDWHLIYKGFTENRERINKCVNNQSEIEQEGAWVNPHAHLSACARTRDCRMNVKPAFRGKVEKSMSLRVTWKGVCTMKSVDNERHTTNKNNIKNGRKENKMQDFINIVYISMFRGYIIWTVLRSYNFILCYNYSYQEMFIKRKL